MVEVKGMDELLDIFDKMIDAPPRAGARALKSASTKVLEEQQRLVPKDTWGGHDNLAIGTVRSYKSGSKYIDIGINKKAPWDKVRGIYFHNYGYVTRGGNYHAGDNWLGRSYELSRESAYKEIKETLIKELGL